MSVQASRIWRSNHVRQSRELSELRNPLSSTSLCTIRKEENEWNKEPVTSLQLQYPRVIPTLISDITDQLGVITKRDNTRSLLPRPVDRVAFAKENPSYQGPGNSKNRLLPRLRSVRVHHANQTPYNLFTECQYPQYPRETTRDRSCKRPVDLVAFAKENPSYIGPGNLKNWLLLRLCSVRVYYAN